jgi:hypothetical protein
LGSCPLRSSQSPCRTLYVAWPRTCGAHPAIAIAATIKVTATNAIFFKSISLFCLTK